MSKQQHTPGPWYLSGTTVYALNAKNFNRFSAQIQDAHTPKTELEANARLIAAAPDQNEALEMTQILLERLGLESSDEYQRNAKALAKARGES